MGRIINLPDAYKLIAYDELGSSNDEAKLIANDADDKTILWTKIQTKGHGRRNNEWKSPLGNLYTSIILKPDIKPIDAGNLSFTVAICLYRTLRTFMKDADIGLKWPNDVLVNGKKISGILLETEIQDNKLNWIVIGVGLNIISSPSDVGISISDVIDPPDIEEVIEVFYHNLDACLQLSLAEVREEWLDNAIRIGENIIVRLPRKELTGIFKGLDNDCRLILSTDAGDVLISSGDVFYG